jgi:hypothetical protein
MQYTTCGRNSAVECFLAKEDVTSSNLVARSLQKPRFIPGFFCLTVIFDYRAG